jgi:hypothetical protein
MKKILLAFVSMLFSAAGLFANDGVFYVSGNTLMLLQETRIALRREVLKFYVKDFDWMAVEVDFEFYNPGAAKTIIVGFVTPPADGDVQEEDHPRIRDFTVLMNEKMLAYKMKRMKETSFAAEKLKVGGEDFVYYFDAAFKPGLNKIRHTYRYQGGGSVDMHRYFDYQITTGKRWANRQIDDFELQIHPDNGVFFVPASFTKDKRAASWRIVGDGVIRKQPRKLYGEESPRVRMVHLNRGYLLLKQRSFRPDTDIFMGEYNWMTGLADSWCERKCAEAENLEKVAPFFHLRPSRYITEEDLAALNARQLKYLRNYFFAVRGLAFQDEEVKKFYGQFFWYKPDAALKAGEMKLSKSEREFVAKVRKIENSLK